MQYGYDVCVDSVVCVFDRTMTMEELLKSLIKKTKVVAL